MYDGSKKSELSRRLDTYITGMGKIDRVLIKIIRYGVKFMNFFNIMLRVAVQRMPTRFWILLLSFISALYLIIPASLIIDYLYKAKNKTDNNQLENELVKYNQNQFEQLHLSNELNFFNELIGVNNQHCELESHNILLIAGNGNGAFGRGQVLRHINALKLHGAHKVAVVGDGASDVDIYRVLDVSKSLKHGGRPVTVIIMAHGIWKDNDEGHLIGLEHGKFTDTCELLKQIKNELGDQIQLSFFIESCFGGRAVKCASYLGDSVVSLAGINNPIFGLFHIDGFILALESATKANNGLSAKKLLETYLLNMEGPRLATLNYFSPMFASSKVAAINLKEELVSLTGTHVNNEVRMMLHDKFDKIIGNDAVDRTIDLISSGKSSYLNWFSGDVGKALLFALEIQENDPRKLQYDLEASAYKNRIVA